MHCCTHSQNNHGPDNRSHDDEDGAAEEAHEGNLLLHTDIDGPKHLL